MRGFLLAGLLGTVGVTGTLGAVPAKAQIVDYVAPQPVQLEAERLKAYPAREAGQGAAIDGTHVYAIVNFAIGQYDRDSGERVAGWLGPRGGPIAHLNSCYADDGRLYCANSNFPATPMASSIETFNTEDMTHEASRSLGLLDEGSLTWFDSFGDGWIAGFAHYDGRGGHAFKDHRFGAVARFDKDWRRMGGWIFPDSVLTRMAPHAASGGAMGPDGFLYVMGHDRPEMYVLDFPAMGPTLLHVATIAIEAEGQAFAWDKSTDERVLVAISRPNREMRVFRIPPIPERD
ncbi:MAG: hypothetical protein ACFB6R_11220 [Alphaproteobacteria bacterium]